MILVLEVSGKRLIDILYIYNGIAFATDIVIMISRHIAPKSWLRRL